jgi:ABC-type branched-subunit amino acid transport system ATPase component/branched-subunit amino acid ABC-type transport system permease component
MKEFLQFAILGLGLSSVYVLLGNGLVMIYRGSGVLNFAHGAYAMATAYLFYQLTRIEHWSFAPAFAVSVGLIGVVGLLTHLLVMRPLRRASPLARLIATLGVLLVIQGLATLKYGANYLRVPSSMPKDVFHLGSLSVPAAQLIMFGIAVVLTVVLELLSRRTVFGLAMTAVAENQTTVSILGRSPDLVAAATWSGGAMLAGAAGILVVPLSGLTVTGLTLTIVAAMAASMPGKFSSFWLTLVFGTVIGIAQSETGNYASGVTGLSDAVPFFVIILVLIVRRNSLPVREHLFERLPRLGSGVLAWKTIACVVAVLVFLIIAVLPANLIASVTVQLSIGLVLLGTVIVTGYAGQLSLGSYAIAGIGAFFAGRVVAAEHWPFLAALALGVVGSFLIGSIIGLVALRTRGIGLAVATLGLALGVYAMLFSNSNYTGALGGTDVGGPSILGFSLDPIAHPERFAIFCLIVFTLAAIAVANLRRGRAGRRMIAVRSNERAAASLGIHVAGAKLWAFAISSAFVGLGGTLIGFQGHVIVYTSFDPLTSINIVAWATVGGIGSVAGPLLGSGLAPGSVIGVVLNRLGVDAWLTIIAGLAVILVLVKNPDGIAQGIADGKGDPLSRWIVRRIQRRRERNAAPAAASTGETPVLDAHKVVPQGLKVEGLTVRYGGVTAVAGLDLEVGPGQIVGLIGPNGAGKTSVIDSVTGFTAAADGTVTLGDQVLNGMPPYKRSQAGITRSFQSVELFDDLTVRENLQAASDQRDSAAFVATLVKAGGRELPAIAMVAVEVFGIADLLDRRPSELSYAHRRLVGIARTVATMPSVLLLDEPAAGFDEDESAGLGELITILAKRLGIGILLVEHDMSLVMTVCERVVVMDFGQRIAVGTPEEIQDDIRVVEAYLGVPVEEDAQEPIGILSNTRPSEQDVDVP